MAKVAREILGENAAGTLATAGGEGPWATSVFFAEEGLDLYFLLENRGRALAHIKANPQVAMAIDRRVPDRFLQMEGRAEILEGPEAKRGMAKVVAKVPTAASFHDLSVLRFRTSLLRVTDFRRGWFPARELKLPNRITPSRTSPTPPAPSSAAG